MLVEVIRDRNKLVRQKYRFDVSTELYSNSKVEIKLDGYFDESRKTTRHKYQIERKWTRLTRRDNTIERPEIPEDVIKEARQKVIQSIIFVEEKNETT